MFESAIAPDDSLCYCVIEDDTAVTRKPKPASEVFPVTAIVSSPALLNLTPTLYTVKPFSSVDAKMLYGAELSL